MEAAIGNAEPNTTYYAILTLVAERGYKFNHDSIVHKSTSGVYVN